MLVTWPDWSTTTFCFSRATTPPIIASAAISMTPITAVRYEIHGKPLLARVAKYTPALRARLLRSAPSLRNQPRVAGPSFKPGDTEEERKSFEEIERWLIEQFDAGPIAYRWVNDDCSSTDCAPFVGWSSSSGDKYLVATGFGAWGISKGTAAATNPARPRSG
jgi:glycine/D-amino acid oxidase-like deaminating enzyme